MIELNPKAVSSLSEKLAKINRMLLAFEIERPKPRSGIALILYHSGYVLPRPKSGEPAFQITRDTYGNIKTIQ